MVQEIIAAHLQLENDLARRASGRASDISRRRGEESKWERDTGEKHKGNKRYLD
jgi:hypothetical protein